jgi:hypothetical protein
MRSDVTTPLRPAWREVERVFSLCVGSSNRALCGVYGPQSSARIVSKVETVVRTAFYEEEAR